MPAQLQSIIYVYIPAQQELNQQRHAFLDWKLTEGLWHHIVEQGESAHSQPGIDKTWFLLLKYSELMMFQTYPSIEGLHLDVQKLSHPLVQFVILCSSLCSLHFFRLYCHYHLCSVHYSEDHCHIYFLICSSHKWFSYFDSHWFITSGVYYKTT